MKIKKSPARIDLYTALTKHLNEHALKEYYTDLKNIEVVKSPAQFQEYVNSIALRAVERAVTEIRF